MTDAPEPVIINNVDTDRQLPEVTNETEAQPALELKLVLIGDASVGKTTFVKRHATGEFERRYIPTKGVEVTPVTFYTTYGPILVNIWDTAGNPEFGDLKDAYYIGANYAIIMFDVTTRSTYKSVPQWYKEFKTVCENVPVALVGNKTDSKDRKVKKRQITYHTKRNMKYYDISSREYNHAVDPILDFLRDVVQDPNLQFTEAPPDHIEIEMLKENVEINDGQEEELRQIIPVVEETVIIEEVSLNPQELIKADANVSA